MSSSKPERIDETVVTSLIVRSFADSFLADTHLDVAIAGAGPSGVTCARLLAARGYKVAIFERNLHVGGGMWGGGMLFPRLVIQEAARGLLDEIGVRLEPAADGYYIVDSVETVTKSTAAAIDAGAHIWVGIAVEDVMIDDSERVCGAVLNWGAVEQAGLHVDPLAIRCKVLIDATGHPIEVVRKMAAKIPGARFDTPTGALIGERPMNADYAENHVVELTREVYPGVIVTGMAANAVAGAPRMGAIFGGMFLSAQRAAAVAAQIVGQPGDS